MILLNENISIHNLIEYGKIVTYYLNLNVKQSLRQKQFTNIVTFQAINI
jgi:hypothetical protein